MPEQAIQNPDIRISPQGLLHCSDGTFSAGNGNGLLKLVQTDIGDDTPGKLYFKQLCAEYIRRLTVAGEPASRNLAALFEQTRPSPEEAAFQTLAAPPIEGIEYLSANLLNKLYLDVEQALQNRMDACSDSLTDVIRSLSPAWKDVGKITFHLAENKGDNAQSFPFAFMVSFIYRAEGDRPRHLPLAAALRAYAGKPQALQTILAPIQTAAAESDLIRDLLHSRRIFQPVAWTSREAYRFLKDIPRFEQANIVVRIANLWKTAPLQAQVSVQLDVAGTQRLDAEALLDFSANVALGNTPLSPDEIRTLLDSEGGLIRLKGQWVEADPEKIRQLLNQWKQAEMLAEDGRLSLAEGLRLLAGANLHNRQDNGGLKENCTFNATGKLRDMLEQLGNPSQINLPELPRDIDRALYAYQRNGVKFLWQTTQLGLGACLADDMGLGKTLQTIALLTIWKKQGLLQRLPAILVLPASLLTNWKNEARQWAPNLTVGILHASAMDQTQWNQFKENPENVLTQFDLALVTYQTLARLTQLENLNFPAVIADEAQAIKTPTSRQSRAVRKLKAPRRIALTGTPVENRLTDLWAIFDFINPGLLGNLKTFLDFIKKLENDYRPLRKLTRPFILRRLKTDKTVIPDLPDKTELKVYCNLTRRQAALYQHCIDNMKRDLAQQQDGIRRKGIVLAYLQRFKQLCNHPAQFLGNDDFDHKLSGKFQRLEELVETIASRQEKVLVFTQYREIIPQLRDFLRACFGRDGLTLHGGTPVKERQNLVDRFQQDDTIPFFVLSLKAAGTGLNLTAANHVIHFDRWWNPAVENQATDRAFRIRQKKNVLVHKFICKGTLEEKIDELMEEKQNLADDILKDGPEKLLSNMSTDELLNFVRLDAQTVEAS